MKETYTRLFWVDGPNCFGKDYFIDKFKNYLTLHTSVDIEVEDPRRFLPTFMAGKRIFDYYNLDHIKQRSIVDGHIEFLKHLHNLLMEDTEAIYIVNRSFLSTISYNFISHDTNRFTEDQNRLISNYVNTYSKLFRNIKNKLLIINEPFNWSFDVIEDGVYAATLDSKVEWMYNQLQKRDNVESVNTDYLRKVVFSFDHPHLAMVDMVDDYESISSSDYIQIAKREFPERGYSESQFPTDYLAPSKNTKSIYR